METNTNLSFEQLSDEILIRRVAQREPSALGILYDRYAPTVLGICLHILGEQGSAEEALKEIFWQVWQSAASYEAQRGSFSSWLFHLTRGLAMEVSQSRSMKLVNK